MKRIQNSHYFEESLENRLENYCKSQPYKPSKNDVIVVAVEGHILKEVDIEDMTEIEAKKKWNEVNTKIQQLKDLEVKLYLRMED